MKTLNMKFLISIFFVLLLPIGVQAQDFRDRDFFPNAKSIERYESERRPPTGNKLTWSSINGGVVGALELNKDKPLQILNKTISTASMEYMKRILAINALRLGLEGFTELSVIDKNIDDLKNHENIDFETLYGMLAYYPVLLLSNEETAEKYGAAGDLFQNFLDEIFAPSGALTGIGFIKRAVDERPHQLYKVMTLIEPVTN